MNEPILSIKREQEISDKYEKPKAIIKRLTPEQLMIYKSIEESQEAQKYLNLIMEGNNMDKLTIDNVLSLAKKYGLEREGRVKIAAESGHSIGTINWFISHNHIKQILDKQEKAPEVSATAGKQTAEPQKPIEKSITDNDTIPKKTEEVEKDLKINTNGNFGTVKSLIPVEAINPYICESKEKSVKPAEILLTGKLMNWRIYSEKVSFKKPGERNPMTLKRDEIDELINELYDIKYNYLNSFEK